MRVVAGPMSIWQRDHFYQNWMQCKCGSEAQLPFPSLLDSALALPFHSGHTLIAHLASPPLDHGLLRQPGDLLNILTGSEASRAIRC